MTAEITTRKQFSGLNHPSKRWFSEIEMGEATHVASLARKVRAGAAPRPTLISEPLRWPGPFHGAWIFNFFINKNECKTDVTDRGWQRGGRPRSLSPE
jgi:hypothetical protein